VAAHQTGRAGLVIRLPVPSSPPRRQIPPRPDLAPSRRTFDGTGRIVNFSDSASIDPHRVDAVIAGHKDAEMIGLEGVFGRARSVT